jgi:hypothetical protein
LAKNPKVKIDRLQPPKLFSKRFCIPFENRSDRV